MECKIKPGHIPSPWEGVAVGATKSLLASTPVIPAQAGIQKGEMRQPCVYLPASQRNGILYTGVTRATTRRGGNMAKRFETTPRDLERTEMSGLLAVRRAPTRRGGNMAKRFETTPRGLERTEMSGLLAVRRAPRMWEHKKDQAEDYKYRVHRRVCFEQHEHDQSPAKNRSGNGNEPVSYA